MTLGKFFAGCLGNNIESTGFQCKNRQDGENKKSRQDGENKKFRRDGNFPKKHAVMKYIEGNKNPEHPSQ